MKRYCFKKGFIIKKTLTILILILFSISFLPSISSETKVLTAGISIEQVPKSLYGTWRVQSTLIDSNAEIFRKKNVDIWNLSRENNVIKLENPFSGASASIVISELSGNYIKFTKNGNYDGKKLIDSVELNIKKNTFTGYNKLKLDTISDLDGHVIKSQIAKYRLVGEKISGTSINQ